MSRLLTFIMVCFGVLAFSKIMSFLDDDTTLIESKEIHAVNAPEAASDKPKREEKMVKPIIGNANITDVDGKKMGIIYNLDTAQIYNISVCEKLYALNFSPEEVSTLQNLRARRTEIEAKMKDIELKEALLKSIQKDLDIKIEKLEKIYAKIEAQSSDGMAGDRINKLVRIYEGMKPKDAANIFNELQISVLLDVASQIKDNKLAPIIAEMVPEKARELTAALVVGRNSLTFDLEQ